MNIVIETRNFDLTPSLKSYINKKFEPLEKFIPASADAKLIEVEIERDTHHRHGEVFVARVKVGIVGLYAEGEGETAFAAVDDVEADIKRELRRHKAKRQTNLLKSDRELKKRLKGGGAA